MKILMLTAQYMPDVYGGAEKQCARIAEALKAEGFCVSVLTSTQKLDSSSYSDAINVRRFYTLFPPDLLGRWIIISFYWLLVCCLWGIKHRNEIDIIHCHQGKFGAFVACVLGKILNKPVLIKIGNSEEHMDLLCLNKKKLFGPVFTKFILWCDPTFVAITNVIENNLKKFGCKTVTTIHNGIDLSLHDMQSYSSIDTSERSVVNLFYHGRLESIKRPCVLLRAFDLAWKSDRSLKMHIVGDGNELEATKIYAKNLESCDYIKFYGAVDNVFKLIERFDIFVNASEAEGFSNSLLEALLCRKIMVSTPVSGASDAIVTGVNGVVSRGFEYDELALSIQDCVRLFFESYDNASEVSKILINDKFQMSVIVDQYKSLYKELSIKK